MQTKLIDMLFLTVLDEIITVLQICSAIIFHFTYKYTVNTLWKGNVVATYKFPPAQIHLANLLASERFPEDFFFGIEFIRKNESESYCMVGEESTCTLNNITRCTNLDSHYREDVLLAKSIGARMFKTSLSWGRILPRGFANFVNQDAMRYYNDVINEIMANGMTPMVTLFDWDLPPNLQLLGGCTNPMLAEWFQEYARIVFQAFGDRVKFWATVNEVNAMAYSDRGMPTMINQSGIADYLCGHYTLLAHAKVYEMYNKSFRQSQNGKVGIIQSYVWMELRNDDSQVDISGQRRGLEWHNGWLTHPIFSKSGDYSKLMRDRVDFKSLFQGFSRSRLPYFTDEEVRLVKGSADFLGINFYGEIDIRSADSWTKGVSFEHDADVAFVSQRKRASDTCTKIAASSAFGKLLERLNNDYALPKLYIAENGYVDIEEIVTNGEIVDVNRIIYLPRHVSQVMKAMQKGIDIRGYSIWSLASDFSRYGNSSIELIEITARHARKQTIN